MRQRTFLVVATSSILVLVAGSGFLVFGVGSDGADRRAETPPSPSPPPDAGSPSSEFSARELEGCPIRIELAADFENTSPEDRRGSGPASRYSFTSSDRPFQLSVTCRIASHNVEEEPSRFLSETTRRMERILPGETSERTRISAGPVPGWRFTTRQDDRLIVGDVLARGVRVVLIQLVGPLSEQKALEAFNHELLTEGIEWTVD